MLGSGTASLRVLRPPIRNALEDRDHNLVGDQKLLGGRDEKMLRDRSLAGGWK